MNVASGAYIPAGSTLTRTPPRVLSDSAPSAFADPFDSPPSPRAALPPRAGMGARALALAGGLLLLVVVVKATAGTVLIALLGMAVAWAVARWRGRVLTRGAGWWGAALGVVAGFAGFLALAAAIAPPGTLAKIRQTNDSLATAKPAEPPEWLKRIDPTGGRSTQVGDSASQRLVRSPAFLIWAGAMGAVLTAAVLGSILGTLGWSVGLLLFFGATGRWLPRREPRVAATNI